MLEQTARIVSENLARAIDRRIFLKRAGQAAFLGLVALATGQAVTTAAYASKDLPNCAPPGPSGQAGNHPTDACHAAACFQHMASGHIYQCPGLYTYPV